MYYLPYWNSLVVINKHFPMEILYVIILPVEFFFFFVVFIVLQYCWGSPENKQYMGWPFIFLKSAWFFCSVLLYNLKLLDILKVKVLVVHSCPTLCDPMDYSPPGSSVHGNSPGKNTVLGCHFLLQGIFPIQGSNLVLHCRQILYHLSHQGSPLDILTF